jgi:hypothetical protein
LQVESPAPKIFETDKEEIVALLALSFEAKKLVELAAETEAELKTEFPETFRVDKLASPVGLELPLAPKPHRDEKGNL